jgi:hypothetical protein
MSPRFRTDDEARKILKERVAVDSVTGCWNWNHGQEWGERPFFGYHGKWVPAAWVFILVFRGNRETAAVCMIAIIPCQ